MRTCGLANFGIEANEATFSGFNFLIDFPSQDGRADIVGGGGKASREARLLGGVDVFESRCEGIGDDEVGDRLLSNVIISDGEGNRISRVCDLF